jgi:hypothetical protein
MTTYYYLHGKCFDEDTFRGTERKHGKEISQVFKEKIREKINITPELQRIRRKGLPSPKYRKSVCVYLYKFFNTNAFPSPDTIDYSDFEGRKRPFPPREPDEEMDNEYEQLLEFHESYRNYDISEYDSNLGFVFAVNDRGFHLEMIGEADDTVAFYFRGNSCLRAFAFKPFNREYEENPRERCDMRIFKKNERSSTMLTGSYPVVILLSSLLKAKEKKPINFTEIETKKLVSDKADVCLSWTLTDELYNRMNNGQFILPCRTTFDDATLKRYINHLTEFGYDIKQVETTIKFKDGTETQKNTYYIPPFVCKKDSSLIIRCIKDSALTEDQKYELIRKFKAESGCLRYSCDDLEETETPTPRKEKWKDTVYALIIYTVLRLAECPLPMTSNAKKPEKKKASLIGLIENHYGSPVHRSAITKNVNSLVEAGLNIKKDGKKFVFDTSEILTAKDLELLYDCIVQSTSLDGNEKTNLIDKLKAKFKNPLI